MIRAFCSAGQARRRPDPVNTSSRRTGSELDWGKSSVSDMCPTRCDSGRTIADQRPALKVGNKDRLRKKGGSKLIIAPPATARMAVWHEGTTGALAARA